MSFLARINHALPGRASFGYELCPDKPRRAIHGLGLVYVDLVITPASVVPAAGATIARATAGATITAGQTLYLDATDSNKAKLAEADVAGKTDIVGMATNNAAAGQPVDYVSAGSINPGATVAVGTVYVLSATAGGICPLADITTGGKISIYGIASTTTNIIAAINNTGVTKA